MARSDRLKIIKHLEELRGRKVVVYVTSDRSPAGGSIGGDAVRPLFDHLRAMGQVEALDLFIYSRGGDIDVPWRMASAFRTTAKKWNALIPFRANSAATLLALGADEIVMGPQGELGPIDPIMNLRQIRPDGRPVQDAVNVEDIMSYLRFVSDRVVPDHDSAAEGLRHLAARIDALALGRAYRTHSHIREVAKRMLQSRAKAPDAASVDKIIKTLAEEVYAHGHAVARNEAIDLGLPVAKATSEIDAAMWELLSQYETDMKLLDPLDEHTAVRTADPYTEDVVLAAIESSWGSHEFEAKLTITAKRQTPANLSVNIPIGLQLPPGLQPQDAQKLHKALQGALQKAQQQLQQDAQSAVQKAMKDQAPVVGVETAVRDGRWRQTA